MLLSFSSPTLATEGGGGGIGILDLIGGAVIIGDAVLKEGEKKKEEEKKKELAGKEKKPASEKKQLTTTKKEDPTTTKKLATTPKKDDATTTKKLATTPKPKTEKKEELATGKKELASTTYPKFCDLEVLTWEDITEQARFRIASQKAKRWSVTCPHDPGITILDLMSWLMESQGYSLDMAGQNIIIEKLIEMEGPAPYGPLKVKNYKMWKTRDDLGLENKVWESKQWQKENPKVFKKIAGRVKKLDNLREDLVTEYSKYQDKTKQIDDLLGIKDPTPMEAGGKSPLERWSSLKITDKIPIKADYTTTKTSTPPPPPPPPGVTTKETNERLKTLEKNFSQWLKAKDRWKGLAAKYEEEENGTEEVLFGHWGEFGLAVDKETKEVILIDRAWINENFQELVAERELASVEEKEDDLNMTTDVKKRSRKFRKKCRIYDHISCQWNKPKKGSLRGGYCGAKKVKKIVHYHRDECGIEHRYGLCHGDDESSCQRGIIEGQCLPD